MSEQLKWSGRFVWGGPWGDGVWSREYMGQPVSLETKMREAVDDMYRRAAVPVREPARFTRAEFAALKVGDLFEMNARGSCIGAKDAWMVCRVTTMGPPVQCQVIDWAGVNDCGLADYDGWHAIASNSRPYAGNQIKGTNDDVVDAIAGAMFLTRPAPSGDALSYTLTRGAGSITVTADAVDHSNATCPRCSGPGYQGAGAVECFRKCDVVLDPTMNRRVRWGGREPGDVALSDGATPAPGAEMYWVASGRGVTVEHPIRETAIATWRERVKR